MAAGTGTGPLGRASSSMQRGPGWGRDGLREALLEAADNDNGVDRGSGPWRSRDGNDGAHEQREQSGIPWGNSEQ